MHIMSIMRYLIFVIISNGILRPHLKLFVTRSENNEGGNIFLTPENQRVYVCFTFQLYLGTSFIRFWKNMDNLQTSEP